MPLVGRRRLAPLLVARGRRLRRCAGVDGVRQECRRGGARDAEGGAGSAELKSYFLGRRWGRLGKGRFCGAGKKECCKKTLESGKQIGARVGGEIMHF